MKGFRVRLASLLAFVALISPSAHASVLQAQVADAPLPPGPYTLTPIAYGATCADVRGASPADGTPIQAYTCNKTDAQSWLLLPVSTSAGSGYQLVSQASNACLTVVGDTSANGAVLQQWQCASNGDALQLWSALSFGSSFHLVSLGSGKCLDLTNGSNQNGTQLQQWDCADESNPNQLWKLNAIPSLEGTPTQAPSIGSFRFHPISNSSACMDVSGGAIADGTPIQAYSCNGTRAQSWTFVPVQTRFGAGYEMIAAVSGSCLEIAANLLPDGAPTDQRQCGEPAQAAQVWQLYPFGSSYELVSLNSGKCLDLTGGDSQNGTRLQQWDCGQGENSNQLWTLTRDQPIPPLLPAPVRLPLKASTDTILQASPIAAVTGQTISLSVNVKAVSSIPAGTVSFYQNFALLGQVQIDASGNASFTIPSAADGTYEFTAQYLGNSSFTASLSSVIQVTVAEPSVGEQALQADAFVDSVGVQTHLTYNDTPYGTAWPTVLSELKSSGIRHLRDGLWNWGSEAPYSAEHRALAAAGIKTTFGISLDYTMTAPIIQAFAADVQDLEALEAPNECDAGGNCGGGGVAGVNNVVAFMPSLTAAASLLQVPLIGPSFTIPSSYANAGDLSSQMSYNNLHVYFGGRNPGNAGWGGGDAQMHRYGSLDFWMDQASQDGGSTPVQITETGYIAFPSVSVPYTIPESVEASYTPRTLLVAFNHGVKRTFLYELLDEVSSPGYGLLRSDMSEKPAFVAVKNLLSLLSDPGTSAFSPGKLDYKVEGGDATVAHTLLEKRDGSFWLVLWSEQSSYDPDSNTQLAVPQQNVTLRINSAATATQIIQFDSTGVATPSTLASRSQSLLLTLTDQLTMIHITPP